ncbi:MAG: hypothetical protein HGB12_16410, partial [Bacteroidetes bacterium]|nr:hypothetical protein [Bacteroidota bacterium]
MRNFSRIIKIVIAFFMIAACNKDDLIPPPTASYNPTPYVINIPKYLINSGNI